MTNKNSHDMTAEEQELFDKRSAKLSMYMSRAIDARSQVKTAVDKAFDAGSEFGYEMGAIAKEDEILTLINDMFYNLTDTEEDAKLTLEIIKQMILRLEDKNDE
jgi:hypothetical protein